MLSKTELDSDKDDFSDYCVLLVEDDEIMRLSLEDRLRLENIPVHAVGNLSSAIKKLEKGEIDLVITDIRLPDGTGIELFSEISNRFPGIPVILMTAFGDVSDAVALVQAGALDYLTKPFNIVDFIGKIERHLSRIADAQLTVNSFGDDVSFKAGTGCLGKSPAMRKIERLVARLRESDSSVLITGESGVGKEVVASLIHSNSTRKQGPMVRVNCAALSPTLIESELFGHEKGHLLEQQNSALVALSKPRKAPSFSMKLPRYHPKSRLSSCASYRNMKLNALVALNRSPWMSG